MSDILVRVSRSLTLVRISSVAALGQVLAIIAMGVLYYVVLRSEYSTIALVALGCFLVAAVAVLVGTIGANALIPLSQEFVEAGTPESPHFQALGDFFYYGVGRRGLALYGFFMSAGFLLANYVLFRAEYIPRAISAFGLVAIIGLLIYQGLQLYDPEVLPRAILLGIPYAPY
jgi:hypothetical protein